MTSALLLHDEGPSAGFGHRARMEALAAAFRHRGIDTAQAPLDEAGLHGAAGAATDVVVVDSYEHRADAVGPGPIVVALDDLERDLAVDLVVVPAGEALDRPTRARRELRGLRYALLTPPDPRSPSGPDPATRTVLVSLGAADRCGTGAAIADLIAERIAALGDGVRIVHVPGPWSVASSNPRVAVRRHVADLGPHLDAADVVVTAGGVTMLESLVRSRPTVVVPTAANQTAATGSVMAADAAVVVGADDPLDAAVAAVVDLLAHPGRRAELGRRAAGLVDGRGADRVTEAVVELL